MTIPDLEGDGLLMRDEASQAILVFAHGAGAGMRHAFMASMAERLLRRRVATLRFEFPFTARGSRRPDRPELLMATVRSAVDAAARLAPELALFAGGKSMGGRMTSGAIAAEPDPRVQGIVFIGFPLHPAKKPSTARAEHLERVDAPMLFVQGTRDELAELRLLEPVVARLGARATLHVVDGADHGFDVLRRSGRTTEESLAEVADKVAAWIAACSPRAQPE